MDERRLSGQSEFGTLLRQYRSAAGLSQEALAERARMSTNGIGALERGYRRTPQRETLALLVSALQLDDARREEFEAAAHRQARTSAGVPTPLLALTSIVGRETELGELALIVAAIATALEVPEVPRRPLLDTLLAYLKSKSLVLLLDNCEHLFPGAAYVAENVARGLLASARSHDKPRAASSGF
ncbi:MAG: helix-turn-helix transcriptional regulator [Candidatus Cybelea sp.]